MSPIELAQQIMPLVQDQDFGTACCAIEIVQSLLSHRESAVRKMDLDALDERRDRAFLESQNQA